MTGSLREKRVIPDEFTRLVLLFAVYVVLASLGLRVHPIAGLATVVWPPSGVAVAAVLLWGPRVWPAIALGAFTVNALVSPSAALGIAIGNTLEALVAGLLIARTGDFKPSLERAVDISRLAVWGAMVSPIVAASFGAVSAWVTGVVDTPVLAQFWTIWWAGDALGVLVVAPMILVWASKPTVPPPSRVTGAVGLALVTAFLLLADASYGRLIQNVTAAFTAFPLLIWLALRYGQRATVTGVATVFVIAALATWAGYGPFAIAPPLASLFGFQAVMGVCALTSMVMAASVSERRRQELELAVTGERLKDEERTLDEAESLACSGSWSWDVRQDRFSWSGGMYRVHGWLRGKMPATYAALLDQLVPADRSLFDSHVQWTLATGEPFDFRHRIRRLDGEVRVLRARGKAALDTHGQIVTLYGTCQDITYAQRMEELLVARNQALADSGERGEAILASLAEGLLVVAPDGRVNQANQRAEEILQRPEGTLQGRRCQDLLGMVCPTDLAVNALAVVTLPNERHLPVRLNAVPIGRHGSILTFRDVSHEEEVGRLKSEFISLASHELRTPLTIMQGSLLLLQEAESFGLSTSQQKDYIKRVLAQSIRMARIVDDLLTVSRIEQGTMTLRVQRVIASELLDDAARDWVPIAQSRGVDLVFLPNDTPLPDVRTDPDHVTRILANLIDNAIKYSPAGRQVTISAKPIPGYLQIVVSDQGIGIGAADLPRLFEKFHRIVSPSMYSQRGSGLGLFITRQLVELQGGHIMVSSQLGEGSAFAFTLPLDQPAVPCSAEIPEGHDADVLQ